MGPVPTWSVAPKIATVGTSSADAMCMLPESFVRYTRARRRQFDVFAQCCFTCEVVDADTALSNIGRDVLAQCALVF